MPLHSIFLFFLAIFAGLGSAARQGDAACLYGAPHGWSSNFLPRMEGSPPLVLWAWERPERLRFIDPKEVGVAVLTGTCRLSGDEIALHPRLQPLEVPVGTFLEAVVRVELDRRHPPELSELQRKRLVESILKATRPFSVSAVQVDFDASVSERTFYRGVLSDLRSRLPDTVALSITGLASWCIHDLWISGTSIDEVVPMLFRMGSDNRQIRAYLRSGGDFSLAVCRESVGISTDEEIPAFPAGRRIYIFHPKPWTLQAFQKITEELKQCRIVLKEGTEAKSESFSFSQLQQ